MPTLEFKGKPLVYAHHLSVPYRELVIDPQKSLPGPVGPNLDDNLIIHGDNLEALKALLPRYAGKVDVIYIDPPYNTGNEGWAYNDNVSSPELKRWLGKVVDRDDLERHDKWLCMMWPRLQLLRELLSPTGAIFVSIDDNEVFSLIEIMNEIFGTRLVAQIPVVNNMKGRNDKQNFARTHEYVVIFAREEFIARGLPLTAKQIAAFKYTDERGEKYATRDLRKRGGFDTREKRPNLFFPIYYNQRAGSFSTKRVAKDDIEILPRKSDGTDGCWRWGRQKVDANLEIFELSGGRGKNPGVNYRIFLDPSAQPGGEDLLEEDDVWDEEVEEPIERESKSKSFWWGPELSTDGAQKQLKSIMKGAAQNFEHPKPVALLRKILHLASRPDSTVLDSFAGSGTTGHAVLAANAEDGGTRRFILIETKEYADELTAERLRRVIRGSHEVGGDLGGSFTYCDLGEPIDLDRFFDGKGAPPWDQVARYVAYTATGQSLTAQPKKPDPVWLAGEAGPYRIHLVYKPDLAFMRSPESALDVVLAEKIAKANTKGRPVLVYASAKFLSQKALNALGITFCQLPYAVHRLLGDAPTPGG